MTGVPLCSLVSPTTKCWLEKMEEASDVAFTTRAGKAVAFKKGKKQVVATPVESVAEAAPDATALSAAAPLPSSAEPPRPKPRAARSAAKAKAKAAPAEAPAEPAAPLAEPPAPAPEPEPAPPEPEPPAPEPPAPRAKPKPRPRAKKSAIREQPPEPLGIELPERPPPLERQPSTFPVMSSDDFGSLFSEYISSRKSQGRDSRLAMYRSWLAT